MRTESGRQNRNDTSSATEFGSPDPDARVGVARRLIAAAEDQAAAQRARNYLVQAGIATERVTIVGRNFSAAQPAGARTTAQAAARGALPGAVVGALVGAALRGSDLVTSEMPLGWLTVTAAVCGVVVGAIIAVLSYGLLAGRRAAQLQGLTHIGRFDLLVDAEVADEAARLLHEATVPIGQRGAGGPV
ncbi:hypothetical protein OHA21_15030 [Actinoplanes sp. NBC_00393]|uniref:hypothetical protein n=1 Tax=Actinoplanes sp. NBC_00393 TaxID=2975953 RepID=UPI002E2217EC